jgi:hypothetical protein
VIHVQIKAMQRERRGKAKTGEAPKPQTEDYVLCEEMDGFDREEKTIRSLPSEECRQLLGDSALQLLCKGLTVCSVCDEIQLDITVQNKWLSRHNLSLDVLRHTPESGQNELRAQYSAHHTVWTVQRAVRIDLSLCCMCVWCS